MCFLKKDKLGQSHAPVHTQYHRRKGGGVINKDVCI